MIAKEEEKNTIKDESILDIDTHTLQIIDRLIDYTFKEIDKKLKDQYLLKLATKQVLSVVFDIHHLTSIQKDQNPCSDHAGREPLSFPIDRHTTRHIGLRQRGKEVVPPRKKTKFYKFSRLIVINSVVWETGIKEDESNIEKKISKQSNRNSPKQKKKKNEIVKEENDNIKIIRDDSDEEDEETFQWRKECTEILKKYDHHKEQIKKVKLASALVNNNNEEKNLKIMNEIVIQTTPREMNNYIKPTIKNNIFQGIRDYDENLVTSSNNVNNIRPHTTSGLTRKAINSLSSSSSKEVSSFRPNTANGVNQRRRNNNNNDDNNDSKGLFLPDDPHFYQEIKIEENKTPFIPRNKDKKNNNLSDRIQLAKGVSIKQADDKSLIKNTKQTISKKFNEQIREGIQRDNILRQSEMGKLIQNMNENQKKKQQLIANEPQIMSVNVLEDTKERQESMRHLLLPMEGYRKHGQKKHNEKCRKKIIRIRSPPPGARAGTMEKTSSFPTSNDGKRLKKKKTTVLSGG